MPRLPNRIMGAHHVYPGVNSAEQYRRWHARVIADNKAAYPNMPWGDPYRWTGEPPLLYVAGGVARVECQACAAEGLENAPAVWIDGEAALACCVECGAVYDGIVVPAQWAEISAALVRRKLGPERYWNPAKTVDDLLAENASGKLTLIEGGA